MAERKNMQRHTSRGKAPAGLVTEVHKWLRSLQPGIRKTATTAPGIYLMRLRAERRSRGQDSGASAAGA